MTGQSDVETLFPIDTIEPAATPMMKQYLEIKSGYQDAILFFRLGDFYEMFYADAEIAARELELTLTGRGKKDTANRMPMCGIPYHAADNYIVRLINKGYKVAICEQVEDPALAKGLTKREVIKVITPGTLIEEKHLVSTSSNYLAAVIKTDLQADSYGLAFADVSTGNFKLTQLHGRENLQSELLRIDAVELLTNEESISKEMALPSTLIPTPSLESARKTLNHHLKLDPALAQLLMDNPLALAAGATIINYLKLTQRSELKQLNTCDFYLPQHYMYLDAASRRNLELTQTIRSGSRAGSVYALLDRTRTAMGSRLLKEWISYPLLDKTKIEERYTAIEELIKDLITREELSSFLKDIYDIERLIGRIANGNANARDLVFLKESLQILKNIYPTIKNLHSKLLTKLLEPKLVQIAEQVINLVEQAIIENPALSLKEGNIIRPGFDSALDELRGLSKNSKEWVARLEAEERARTGIKSLKIGYTSVFGYYIEVSNANKELVPINYVRKQTLTNAERFITPELKEKETDILNATAKIEKLEYELFNKLRLQIAQHIQDIQKIAQSTALLDTLLSLANIATANNYIRPQIIDQENLQLTIQDGRHPVVEKTLPAGEFIPNHTELTFDNRMILLFGPNMSGKSTYMRQNALLILLAQMGSFVPAKKMEFTLVDRLFTRVGAMDDLFSGKSTFMVEMSETANILRQATPRSFIILDEVGRGTSTYDGMAIAWALAEHIYLKIGAKTIFATHYHELAQLAETYPGISNHNVAVQDNAGEIIFLHKVIPGPASGSYGIHVAKLAGIPAEVISRAETILKSFHK